jgi:DNA processing protein
MPLSSAHQITSIQFNEPHYPCRLYDLYDPPKTLYTCGNIELLKQPMIAIVGSRGASTEGLKHAALFATALSDAGILVISGLARGIDGSAHQAALTYKNRFSTLAVCGTGLNRCYPAEHQGLAKEIIKNGLLMSELLPNEGPKAFHFPRRNRIIAALSLGVVVIQAANRSGSLITARLAAELGREVFAVPGPIGDPLYMGCHQLIQQGAKLVCSPKEVLEELPFLENPALTLLKERF